MSVVFLLGIFMMIFVFGGLVLAGFAIWALATKNETLPKWVKVVLWLFVSLAAVLLIVAIVSVLIFFGKFIMY